MGADERNYGPSSGGVYDGVDHGDKTDYCASINLVEQVIQRNKVHQSLVRCWYNVESDGARHQFKP